VSAIEKSAVDFSHYNERVDLEHYLNHLIKTNRKKAYFFVCTVNGDGTDFQQKSFHKSEKDKALKYIKKSKNKRIFVPTVLFDTRERLEENIGQVRKVLIDLDIYKSEKFKEMKPEEVLEDLQENFFFNGKIPMPNAVTFSGGGLYLEWHLKYTPGGKVLSKRRVIAKILYEMLNEYGPDAKSLDAPHVFGLADTINWKHGSNSVVKSFKNDVSEYTLAELSRSLPSLWDVWKKNKNIETDPESRPKSNTKKFAKIMPIHKERTLAFDHIESIRQLIVLRNGDMEEYREKAIFFVRNAYHKMHQKRYYDEDEELFKESYKLAIEINNMFKPKLKEEEIQKATLNKKKLYRFKTETFVEWFDITMEEQIQIKVKTPEAKRVKSKLQMDELRRSRGIATREEYEQKRKEEKEHSLDFLKKMLEKNPKIKRNELAELMGVSVFRIDQLKRELKSL
jgi:hypothetical protein